MHQPKGFAEAERPVGAYAVLVLKFRVTGQFGKTHLFCPCFRPGNERPANSFAAQVGIDIPAFDVTDARRHRAIDPMANGQLYKAAKLAMAAFVDEDGEFAAADLLGHFEVVHLWRAIGPERSTHPPPFGEIIASDCADHVHSMRQRYARSNATREETPAPTELAPEARACYVFTGFCCVRSACS